MGNETVPNTILAEIGVEKAFELFTEVLYVSLKNGIELGLKVEEFTYTPASLDPEMKECLVVASSNRFCVCKIKSINKETEELAFSLYVELDGVDVMGEIANVAIGNFSLDQWDEFDTEKPATT